MEWKPTKRGGNVALSFRLPEKEKLCIFLGQREYNLFSFDFDFVNVNFVFIGLGLGDILRPELLLPLMETLSLEQVASHLPEVI